MPDVPPKPIPAQSAETTTKKAGARKRRISELMPELRERITPLFARGVAVERIAEELGIENPPVQILEHVFRDIAGVRHPGPYMMRKGARSESGPMTVSEFKRIARTA